MGGWNKNFCPLLFTLLTSIGIRPAVEKIAIPPHYPSRKFEHLIAIKMKKFLAGLLTLYSRGK